MKKAQLPMRIEHLTTLLWGECSTAALQRQRDRFDTKWVTGIISLRALNNLTKSFIIFIKFLLFHENWRFEHYCSQSNQLMTTLIFGGTVIRTQGLLCEKRKCHLCATHPLWGIGFFETIKTLSFKLQLAEEAKFPNSPTKVHQHLLFWGICFSCFKPGRHRCFLPEPCCARHVLIITSDERLRAFYKHLLNLKELSTALSLLRLG